MGIISKIFQRKSFGVTRADITWPEDIPLVNTYAGASVTPESSIRLTAVWACFRLLSETIGSLPIHVYERKSNGDRERATDHPYDFLISSEPNSECDSSQHRELTVTDLLGWGNSAHYIERDRFGRVIALWPLHQSQIKIRRLENRKIVYDVTEEIGSTKTYSADEIWHPMILPELTKNGLIGRSPVMRCRQAIGLGRGAEEYGGRLFANDGRSTGVIEVEGKLGRDAEESRAIRGEMQAQWTSNQSGANRHKIAILDQGMKFKPISINPDDAQFLETRRFQVEEIARIYGIPPDMIGAVDKTSSWGTGVEQRSLQFGIYTVTPYLVKIAQSLNRCLFTREEKARYFIEFDMNGLLRGDTKSRYEAYGHAIQWGFMNRNEVRRRENLNAFDDGDRYYMPANMLPIDQPTETEGAGRIINSVGNYHRAIAALQSLEEHKANGKNNDN